jgi:hypothetical protein
MKPLFKNVALCIACVLVSLVFMASHCKSKVENVEGSSGECPLLVSVKQSYSGGIGAELSYKGHDMGKGRIDAEQVKGYELAIDEMQNSINTWAFTACENLEKGRITRDQFNHTQDCLMKMSYDLSRFKMLVLSGTLTDEEFKKEIYSMTEMGEECKPSTSSSSVTSSGATTTQGATCGSDADCVPPLYCILGGCRPIGKTGDSCGQDIDCELPLLCSGGKCVQTAGPSNVYGTPCTSDANCQAPLFCILSTCRYLGNKGDACGVTIDCYEPLVCTNGICTQTSVTPAPTPGPTTGVASTVWGTACTSDAGCQPPLYCILKTCRYLGNPGESCEFDYDCHIPYVCTNGKCANATGGTAGGSIGGSASTAWSATVSGYVSIGGGGGGGAKSCSADDQCVKPDYCIVGYCRPLQPDNGVCTYNNDCKSGTCTGGLCGTGSTGVGSGGACTVNENCPLYNTCIAGKCTPSTTGTSCKTDNDCQPPNFCIVGACRPLQGAGGVCNITADCLSGLSCINGTCVQ